MNRNTNVENMHFTANDAKPVLAPVGIFSTNAHSENETKN